MSTGAKIAIGCGVFIVVSAIAVVVGFVGLGYWAKGKAESMMGEQKKIQQLQTKANTENPFTAPVDGTINEPRLEKFLEVRQRIFAVYDRHKDELEAMKNKKQGDFSDLTKGLAVINEVRLARAQALADVGMSESEYQYYVAAIYTSMVGAEVSKATGGKKVSQVVSESMQQARKALEAQANATPDPSLPPEAQKAMREVEEQARQRLAEMDKQSPQTVAEAEKADVPQVNIDLIRKHETEIKKYAMGGLEVLGL